MARVFTQKKIRRGATINCTTCAREIIPGEVYYKWSFNWDGTYYACFEHYPNRSQLTQSKMKSVYLALEVAERSLKRADSVEDVNAIVQSVAEPIREIATEYRDASEAMGAAGETSQTAASALESAADKLEFWEAEVASGNGERLAIEKEEWAAMLRERGLDPGDYNIENVLSRHNAFVAQELDEEELERRVETRFTAEGTNAVKDAKEQALGVISNLQVDA